MITPILQQGIVKMINDALYYENNQYIVDLLLSYDLSRLNTLNQLDELCSLVSKAHDLTVVPECQQLYYALIDGISVTINTTCRLN